MRFHRDAAAAGRRSLVSLPKAGSPHRSPRLAPAASAEPSRESRAKQRSDREVGARPPVLDDRLLRAPAGVTVDVTRNAAPHRARVVLGVAFSAAIVVACFLTARRLTTASWPLQRANLALVLIASVAYLSSFFLRALGWQRLFPGARPGRSRCLAAGGSWAARGVLLSLRLGCVVVHDSLR